MKSKFTKLLATALVLCLVLALLPAAAFAGDNDLGIDVAFYDLDGNSDEYGSDGSVVITKGSGENQYVITATPSPDYGLTTIIVTVKTETEDPKEVLNINHNSSAEYTGTFEAANGSTVSVYARFLPMYNVNINLGIQNGTVEPNVYKAFEGGTVTLTVSPRDGYSVDSVSVTATNDIPVQVTGNDNSWSFSMPASNVTVGATFEAKETFEITTATSELGYVTAPASAYEGQVVSVSATATVSGASVESIKITNTSDGEVYQTISGASGTFDMPAFPVTVEAVFEAFTPPVTGDYYIIYANNLTGGRIIHDTDKADEDDIVYVYIDPDQLWETDDVYYTLLSSYGLEVYGGELSYAGPAANGYEKWYFRMPASNVAVYATFTPYHGFDYHDITVSNPGWHCSVSVPSGAYCGQNVEIKLSNFDAGYAFSYLKVNGEFVKPYGYNGYLSATFTMPHNNVAIEVGTTSVSGKYYIATSYDSTLGGVEVWVNNNYTGNNWHQGSWADHNDTVSFKVKPYYSDDVVSVSVVGKQTGWTYSYDYNSYSGWYTFSMPKEDVTISVDFRSGVHKVYVDKVTDGKLTVSDDWAKYGQIVYVTAVPDYGCTLSSLSVRTATGDSVHVYNAQKADTYYFYMPDQYVSVSAVFTGKYTSVPFNDVSYGDWYYNAVQFVYSRGIMDGVDYYKFAPNGTITRGMILTMLWRMAGEPFEMPVTSFTDVEIGRYYTTAVAWACRNGIADGMGESTFGPNDAITREELVTLMYRYAQYFGHSCIGTSIEGFADAGSVSSYAYNAMCWAYKAGVVTGTTGSRLNPQGTASRAEAAQMIMSFYSFLNS